MPTDERNDALMKALQYLLIAVIIVAGVLGVVCALAYLPFERAVLPAWITNLLPVLGTSAAGWLIFGIIAAIVLAALAVAGVNRAIERRSSAA